jgi:hypothetical protein
MLKMGSTQPSYATCAGATLLARGFNLRNISNGTWFCVKTNQNRFARMQVVAKHPYPTGIDIAWTTWKL